MCSRNGSTRSVCLSSAACAVCCHGCLVAGVAPGPAAQLCDGAADCLCAGQPLPGVAPRTLMVDGAHPIAILSSLLGRFLSYHTCGQQTGHTLAWRLGHTLAWRLGRRREGSPRRDARSLLCLRLCGCRSIRRAAKASTPSSVTYLSQPYQAQPASPKAFHTQAKKASELPPPPACNKPPPPSKPSKHQLPHHGRPRLPYQVRALALLGVCACGLVCG